MLCDNINIILNTTQMKNSFKYLFFLVLIISFISCDKNDDLTVYLKTSGRLTAKLVDNTGTTLSNTSVKLYEYYNNNYGSSSLMLEELKTNSKGIVDFGDLNASTYTLVVDGTNVAGIMYFPVKTIQVVSASDKDVIINVRNM